MKQFNLEKYLINPSIRVITRSSYPVRIICTDAEDNKPIVALIKISGAETIWKYPASGKAEDTEPEHWADLFFKTEKHEGWVNIYLDEKYGNLCCRYVFSSEEEARQKRAKEAIATAKIEWEEYSYEKVQNNTNQRTTNAYC